MDSNYLIALSNGTNDDLKPTIMPIEHWIPNSNGMCQNLYPGYVINDEMEYDDFKEKDYSTIKHPHAKKRS